MIDSKQATSREVFSEALQKYEHQRQQQQQQREAMETMVDESVKRHQQHPNDFAEGDHVLLIAGPGSEEIPGTVVSITPEQVIVHFVLIDGSIMEYPLSPQALQKQQSASDEELQP
jgi:transcription antitermination factor NusG